VIDHDRTVADTLVMVLNFSEFDAVAAHSGESALELASQSSFDKVVSDVMMAPMNGIQAALAISESRPSCQVLLISGNKRTSRLLREAFDAGHEFTILAKPVHPTTIIDHLLTVSPPASDGGPDSTTKELPSKTTSIPPHSAGAGI
jgi:DNA-binding NtrC family response regulator